MKGVVEQVVSRFEMRGMYFDRFPADAGLTPQWLHPYRSARVVADGVTVGWFGQLHPREAAARKIKDAVLVGEIYLDRLYKLSLRRPIAREISRYQPVRRDFSLVLDESIDWETIDRAMAGIADSRTGGVARARGVPRRAAWRTRVCALAGRHVPGAGSHPARRGTAEVPGAGGGSGWQGRGAACGSEQNIERESGLYSNRNGPESAEVETMSETFWESDGAVETASQTASVDQSENAQEEPAALAVSADDFAALEERIRRAVDLVKRERQARAGAEARSAELEARLTEAEAQVQAQSPIMDQLQSELTALRAEREQVRQRVERLLKQLDTLEL